MLGISCMLKIYPVFLIGFSILIKNKMNVFGFAIACLLATALTTAYFGLDENIFFFVTLLPVLLSEQVSDYGSNMNIQAFLLSTGLMGEGFPLFDIQRVGLISILAIITYQHRNAFEKNITLILSLWICSMLLLLSNYWLQYQLLLLIPIIILLSHVLTNYSFWKLLIIMLVIITMSIDDRWTDILIRNAMEQKQLTSDMVIEMVQNNGILHTGFQISPLSMVISMVIQLFSVLKVFIPHMLIFLTIRALSASNNTDKQY